jgi:hypothetical protein
MGVAMKWFGAMAMGKAHRGAAAGLYAAAEYLRDASMAITPVAPVEGGLLRDSCFVSMDDAALRAAVSFDTDYAVEVHEDMTWRHATGTKAKYLEGPLNSERATLLRIMAGGVADALGAGDPGKEMITYTSKAGVVSQRTRAEVANYTRNKTTS